MLIRDIGEYRRLREIADSLIIRNREYPDYVFRKQYSNYNVMESPVSVEFEWLQSIAELHGDLDINLLHYYPDGEEFWFKKYGHFGAIAVEVKGDEKEWNADLNQHPPDDLTFLYTADGQAIIFGDTQKWCIYRNYAFDLSVLAMNFDLSDVRETTTTPYVHDAEWGIGYWKGNLSRMDEKFYGTFRANYSR